MAVRLKLDPAGRMFLCGKTNSGKTFLGRHILKQLARKRWRIVIVDPKHYWMEDHPENFAKKGPGTVDAPVLVTRFNPKLAVQCYQPAIPAWRDADFDQLCADVLETGDTVFYVDESDGVCTAGQSSNGLSRIWTQGRAKRVMAIVGSQRPVRLLEVMKSQAETWIVFTLMGKRNRQEVAEYTDTPQIITTRLPLHWYWLWTTDMDSAQLMRPLEAK